MIKSRDTTKNNQGKYCPHCGQALTQVGVFWICPAHGQISDSKPFAPLRIFLSYGHDDNKELVHLIRADLEKRGHDVWFDKTEIKSGDDWRSSITDGITKCHKFMSFLSKYSTRDPGVCLDEIAIAIGAKGGNIQTILVESERDVHPPTSISHIQWLDMHDWKDQRAAGDQAWEKWYQEKLAEIVRVVESDESRRFAGEIRTLEEYLKPISSESRISQLLKNGLVGRAWLIDAIERWLDDANSSSRVFWLLGAPGVGKSAFAAHLTHFGRDKVIAAQFCEWDKPDHKNAQRVIRSIAFQIATRLPDYRELLLRLPEINDLGQKKSAELFDYLLVNPLCHSIDGGRQRYLIVIDALDEAREGTHNPLAETLADNALRLPEWIRLVITSRPENDVMVPLQDFHPFFFKTETEENQADLREYLRLRLLSKLEGRSDAERIIGLILEKSEGTFLYVEYLCRDLLVGNLSLDNIEGFPQGLGQVFLKYLQRHFTQEPSQAQESGLLGFMKRRSVKIHPDHGEANLDYYRQMCRPFLELITTAQEPLHQGLVTKILGLGSYEQESIIKTFGSLLTERGDKVCFSHKLLTEWICNKKKAGGYWIDQLSGHTRFSDAGMEEFQKGVSEMDPYFKDHLHVHLLLASDWDNLITLIKSNELNLIERWTSKGYPHEGLMCLRGLVGHLIGKNKQLSFAAGLLTQIAGILSLLSKYSEAEKELLRAQKLSDNRRISSIALHELGSLYLYRGDLPRAYQAYKDALDLCEKEAPTIDDEAAANLLGMASVRLLQYAYEDVYRLAGDALQKAKDAGDISRTVAAHRTLASAYKDHLLFDKSNEYLQTAELLIAFSDLPMERIALYHLQAWVEFTRSILLIPSTLDLACDMFKKTIDESKRCSYTAYKASAMLGLAKCALTQYDVMSAQDLLSEVEPGITSESSYDLIIGVKLLRAAVTHQQGNLDLAHTQYMEAKELCQKYLQKARETEAWQGMGATRWHRGNVEDAESCWRRAELLSEQCSPARKGLVQKGIERSRANRAATPL